MSITGATLHWRGATGQHRRTEGPEYTAVWRVTTDDAQDQVQTVINWFRLNRVELGDDYNYAGDTSETVAKAQSIQAEREQGSAFVWVVTVQYAPTQDKPEENEDEEGNETDNPLEFRRRLSVDRVEITKPVEEATYLGGYGNQFEGVFPVNSRIPPMNSAYIPFVPGLERPHSQYQVTVTANQELVGVSSQYLDAVNIADLFIIGWFGFTMEIPKWSAKINQWRVAWKQTNGVPYWEESLGFLFDPDTWVRKIADRGLHARAEAGDPDGRGGTISPSDTQWTIDGVPRVRRLTDPDGQPLAEPVLFDGNGQPLDPNNGAIVPVYSEWLPERQIDFRQIPIWQGILLGV